jgi:hypothetical protein
MAAKNLRNLPLQSPAMRNRRPLLAWKGPVPMAPESGPDLGVAVAAGRSATVAITPGDEPLPLDWCGRARRQQR